jgi:hypothetical protein
MLSWKAQEDRDIIPLFGRLPVQSCSMRSLGREGRLLVGLPGIGETVGSLGEVLYRLLHFCSRPSHRAHCRVDGIKKTAVLLLWLGCIQ